MKTVFLDRKHDETIRRWAPNACVDFLPLPNGRVPVPSDDYSFNRAKREIENQRDWFKMKSRNPDASDIVTDLESVLSRMKESE